MQFLYPHTLTLVPFSRAAASNAQELIVIRRSSASMSVFRLCANIRKVVPFIPNIAEISAGRLPCTIMFATRVTLAVTSALFGRPLRCLPSLLRFFLSDGETSFHGTSLATSPLPRMNTLCNSPHLGQGRRRTSEASGMAERQSPQEELNSNRRTARCWGNCSESWDQGTAATRT